MKPSQDYVSYLLRLWRSGKGPETVWRASLESPLTGKRQGFASLQDLFAFLEARAKEIQDQDNKIKDDDGDGGGDV